MKNRLPYQETMYGFRWGAATVVRIASDGNRGWVALEIQSPKESLRVRITKSGLLRDLITFPTPRSG